MPSGIDKFWEAGDMKQEIMNVPSASEICSELPLSITVLSVFLGHVNTTDPDPSGS